MSVSTASTNAPNRSGAGRAQNRRRRLHPALLASAVAAVAVATCVTNASAATPANVSYDWAGTGTGGLNGFSARSSSGSVKPGQNDPLASDGKVLELKFTSDKPYPGYATEVESPNSYLYGTFTQSMRTADCSGQSNVGAVSGMFTYGNDGQDHDNDGLPDNSEIDFEILCARPDIINMSIWTDYSDADGAQSRVSRSVNLATGKVLDQAYYTSFDNVTPLTRASETSPSSVQKVTGFNSAKSYYTYTIKWQADRVVFEIVAGGKTITLWDYQGPKTRIPQRSSSFVTNIWHTPDWTPPGKPAAIKPPTAALFLRVDSTTIWGA